MQQNPKRTKIESLKEMILRPQGPDPVRDFFKSHDLRASNYMMIWHGLKPDSSFENFMNESWPLYQDDIEYKCYPEHVARMEPQNMCGMSKRTRFVHYWRGDNELTYFNKTTNEILIINSLKNVPNEKS
jgi:hypothetical protein